MAWVAIFVPALVFVQAVAGPHRANLPAGGLEAGEALLVSFEIMRPVAIPLAVALFFACCVCLFLAGWLLGPAVGDVFTAILETAEAATPYP